MSDPIETVEGWYALHDFRQIDRPAWANLTANERDAAVSRLQALAEDWQETEDNHEGSTGIYQIIGHKADLLFVNMRPAMDDLAGIELAVDQSAAGQVLRRPYSYFSVVELSKYLVKSSQPFTELPGVKERLFPILPKTHYICFYPMNKRREGNDNWYSLSREQRREIMKGHGIIGHRYADRVTQVITGSQGLDDWEWGVTLYSDDTLDFKKLIYEMRFDEASARFAEFGPFMVGRRLAPGQLGQIFG